MEYYTLSLLLSMCMGSAISGPPKYAPRYCVRLKFDCSSERSVSHVCCRFPLPPADMSEAELELSQRSQLTNKLRPVNIRPIRLPGSKVPYEDEQKEQTQSQEQEKQDKDIITVQQERRASLISTKTTKDSRPKKTASPESSKIMKKPKICQRLVVDCEQLPKHRCCKHKLTEENQEEASEIEGNSQQHEQQRFVEEKETLYEEDKEDIRPEGVLLLQPQTTSVQPVRPPLVSVEGNPVKEQSQDQLNSPPLVEDEKKSDAAVIPVATVEAVLSPALEKHQEELRQQQQTDQLEQLQMNIPEECFEIHDIDCNKEQHRCCVYLHNEEDSHE